MRKTINRQGISNLTTMNEISLNRISWSEKECVDKKKIGIQEEKCKDWSDVFSCLNRMEGKRRKPIRWIQ